jgi:hypothetical protein
MVILTLASMILAIVTSAIALRVWSRERQRADARVAALASAIHAPSPAGDLRLRPDADDRAGMFAVAAQPSASGSHWGIALAAGALVVATIGAAAIVFSGESPSAATPVPAAVAGPPAPASTTPTAAVPLELSALTHEREQDQLTVRGVVRNPANGAPMDRLTAVVFLFDREGGFLSSGRASVVPGPLVPGGESTFVVSVPAAGDVARYRVSFRADERVVPHVDRRSAP